MQNARNSGVEKLVFWTQWSGVNARRISTMTGVAQTQVWGILQADGFYLHLLQRAQHL
jgi:hypothetical protein